MNLDLEWSAHPDNPLIEPIWPEWLLGDPVALPEEQTPDGLWHMFLNTVLFIYHYTSEDGVKWRRRNRVGRGMRCFIYKEGETYYMFHERHIHPWRSNIVVRFSKDLWDWSRPRRILRPGRKWEREGGSTVCCPCVVRDGDVYKLYYSAGNVFLKDLGFAEPKYIGVAEATSLLGPYRKRNNPLFAPDECDPLRNMGAGAIKVYRDDENDRWVAFNNGIYTDSENRSRSAITVLFSSDGNKWEEPHTEPLFAPGRGWEKALVYQLDAVLRPGGELWVYYNARDGWRAGTERIGLKIGRPVND